MTDIPFHLIDEGARARTQYSGIEDLAAIIAEVGLVQPIVLRPSGDRYALVAGGRRYRALLLLGTTTLFHASTSVPGRPGYLLKDADDELSNLIIELVENQNRQDMWWVDEMKAITVAWRKARLEANARGEELMAQVFGAMVGKSHARVQSAAAVYDDYMVHPERYDQCNSITAAFQVLLKIQSTEIARLQAARSIQVQTVDRPMEDAPPTAMQSARPVPRQQAALPAEGETPEPVTLQLSRSFFCMSAADLMSKLPDDSVDHIITDPDYGVSIERLEAGVAGAAQGVAQSNVEQTLSELESFLKQAWRILRVHSFLVMFYDLDHHEKIAAMAVAAGFRVQRWPLIWHKTDYRGNAAPTYNFCKNMEYAMVLRMPNAVLTGAQMTSVFSCPSQNVAKQFGHPFAKPIDLWTWIYRAVTIQNQIVFDPFMGSASSGVSAIRNGLRPFGCEVMATHYSNGLSNLKQEYRAVYGADTLFT